MAKIELQWQTDRAEESIPPVTLDDGTVVKLNAVTDGDKKRIRGTAVKDGQEVATFHLNPDGNRLFVQVQPLNAVENAVVLDIMETFMEAIRHHLM